MSIVVGFDGADMESEASTATTSERFLPDVEGSQESEYIWGMSLSVTDISLGPMLWGIPALSNATILAETLGKLSVL
jgi:hypothetical protein